MHALTVRRVTQDDGAGNWHASYRPAGSDRYHKCFGQTAAPLTAGDQIEARSRASKTWYPAIVVEHVDSPGTSVEPLCLAQSLWF